MSRHRRENDYAMIGPVGVVLFNEVFLTERLPFRNWLRKTETGWFVVGYNKFPGPFWSGRHDLDKLRTRGAPYMRLREWDKVEI